MMYVSTLNYVCMSVCGFLCVSCPPRYPLLSNFPSTKDLVRGFFFSFLFFFFFATDGKSDCSADCGESEWRMYDELDRLSVV